MSVEKSQAELDAEKVEFEKKIVEEAGIKVEEKSYAAKEVEELIRNGVKKGANISKNQLYSQIEGTKSKLIEIEKLKSDLEKEKLEKDAKIKVLEDSLSKKPDNSATEEELKKIRDEFDLTQKKLKIMEEEAAKAINSVNNLKEEIKGKELEAYKANKIADAKGRLVPEMVVGSTKEEIDKSVAKAKETFENFEKEMRSKLGVPEEKKETPEETIVEKLSVRPSRTELGGWNEKRNSIVADVYKQHGFNV